MQVEMPSVECRGSDAESVTLMPTAIPPRAKSAEVRVAHTRLMNVSLALEESRA